MKRSAVCALVAMLLATTLHAQDRYAAAIVLEPTTGQVLFEKNAHTPLPTASMVKMVTLLVVMDAIRSGVLTLQTPVTISARASGIGGSQVFLAEGEQFPVQDLIAATMVHSANDAATALAEQAGGSVESFVRLMNQKAQQLHLENSRFYDPHGLPAGPGQQPDVMTAADLAKVGMELMKVPLMRQLAVQQEMPFRAGKFKMTNPNKLLGMYPGAIGIKTGYSVSAGFCVTGSAHRGDMDLVCVVMGSKQKRDCFESAAELMTAAFSTHQIHSAVKRGQRVGAVPVKRGEASTVSVVSGGDANVLVKAGQQRGVSVTVDGGAVPAPVRRGQRVGTVVVRNGSQLIASLPALAAVDVAKQPWWKILWPF